MGQSLAHLKEFEDGSILAQTAAEHSINTAKLAAGMLSSISLDKPAYLAGILHDMGKFKNEFQEYLINENRARGSVVHTFAGAKFILDTFHKTNFEGEDGPEALDILAELVGYAIASHHGTFDISESGREIGFSHRIDKRNIGYKESVTKFFRECVDRDTLDNFVEEATSQIESVINKILYIPSELTETTEDETCFYVGLLERLLLSAVIDGDRIDTATFMRGDILSHEKENPDWKKYLSFVEEKLDEIQSEKPIDLARRKISDQCRQFAEKPGGILRLNVPTGAGKTLSSLRYALAHAASSNKSRIIFTAPLLTILEQNADVIRNFIQDDSVILEHHSNVIIDKDFKDELSNYEILIENWDAPIIITSMVQLLNTMFDGKTTSIRRFHSLANSVIVIDEVQTVPIKLLSLFNLTLNFLTQICGATIVLCSATQPCFDKIEHVLEGNIEEIVPYDPDIWSVFKRTNIIDVGRFKLEQVAGFVEEKLQQTNSLLVVCNKKSEAETLYKELKREDIALFHLSASMCMEHRRDVLVSLRKSLNNKQKKTVCVSTQVIEAGVDISFEMVIRFAAGMDSIVQAAGRCNRNAENSQQAPVYIMQIIDEDLRMLGDIQRCKDSTIALLSTFSDKPQLFMNDLSSEKSISFYYNYLFRSLEKGETEFTTGNYNLFDLLGRNKSNLDSKSVFYMQQAFRTAGEKFKVFDDNRFDVIIPYEKGRDLLCELASLNLKYDFEKIKKLIDKAKQYTVSLYSYQQKLFEQENAIYWLCDGTVAVLDESYYHPETGITFEKQLMEFQEV